AGERADTPRVLGRALLEVEFHVLLCAEVDAKAGEGAFEGRQHPVARERRVPLGAAPRTPHIPAPDLAQPEADARAEEPVARLRPEALRVGEQAPALLREVVEREAEAAVEVRVAVGAEPPGLALHDLRRL